MKIRKKKPKEIKGSEHKLKGIGEVEEEESIGQIFSSSESSAKKEFEKEKKEWEQLKKDRKAFERAVNKEVKRVLQTEIKSLQEKQKGFGSKGLLRDGREFKDPIAFVIRPDRKTEIIEDAKPGILYLTDPAGKETRHFLDPGKLLDMPFNPFGDPYKGYQYLYVR